MARTPAPPISRVYLASRFARQRELRGYVAPLAQRGIEVTSRWLVRAQANAMDPGVTLDERARAAAEDIDDLDLADALLAFTDEDPAQPSKGGFHTEIGYALGLGLPVLLIGPRLNVFHHLADIEVVPTWEEALAWIDTANGGGAS